MTAPGVREGGAGDVVLRPLRWWDLMQVARLERELFGPTAWSVETFWSELAQHATRRYLAADLDGRVVGYAGVMVGGAEADVQTVGVDAGVQGRGVGRRLLRELIGLARDGGASALLLEVRADNAPAIALYRSEGFEQIAVRRRYYQPGDVDALVMRLRPLPGGVPA
ncbi:MAG: ribosomal protein S18-alanine N-acetyltransferase [Kineosporiaceae bacterium]